MTNERARTKIDTYDKTIQECFLDCLYRIPRFQRPYSWGTDQLTDYWSDVVINSADYFLGATVTYIGRERDLFRNEYVIIDGQQRLTTSAIVLASIRDKFEQISEDGTCPENLRIKSKRHAEKTQGYLTPEDDDSNTFPVIDREETEFRFHILKLIKHDEPKGGQRQRRIVDAKEFFDEKINKELNNLDPEQKIKRLLTLRSNTLRARVIQIELDSEENGFMVFETLNTRGLDLELPDLIKNLLIRDGANSEADREAIAKHWDSISERINSHPDYSSKPPESRPLGTSDFSRFIWQSWNSRRSETKEAQLFKELKSAIASEKITYEQYLKELEEDARIYIHLNTQEIKTELNKGKEREFRKLADVVDSIRALQIFGVSVANSALLSAVRAYHSGSLTERDLKRLTRSLENYHFLYNALGAVGSNGGMRKRYNRFAINLAEKAQESRDKSTLHRNCKKCVDDLIDSLRESSLKLKERGIDSFRKLFYTGGPLSARERLYGRASLIQYVLLTIAQRINSAPSGAGFNTNDLSIEHIVPKSRRNSNSANTNYIITIGNLTVLKKKLNNDLGDADFDKKRKVLRSALLRDPVLQSWLDNQDLTTLSQADIQKRTDALAEIAVNEVWAL